MKNYVLEILKSIRFKLLNLRFFSKKNKISLEKNNDFTNISIKISKNNIIYDNYKECAEFVNIIKKFLVTLHTKCKNFSPDLFLKNYKNTLFKINDLKKDKLEAYYSTSTESSKRLNILKVNDFGSSNHELLHQASSKSIDGVVYSGFSTYSNSEYIGVGINEGYTQLLSERYFCENEGSSYFIEVEILKILENIVGKDKMEKYYFKADCSSLITQLTNYEEYNSIIEFIKDVDCIHYIKENNLLDQKFNEFKRLINKIYEFLFSCCKNKVINFINNNVDFNKDVRDELRYLLDAKNWSKTYTITVKFNEKIFKFDTLDINKFISFINSIENILNNNEITSKSK